MPDDPITRVDLGFLRNQAGAVLSELIAALPASARARVEGIPFAADPTVGEVNAYAACDDAGALMAITDGLLEIEARIAQYRAIDEIWGTNKLATYEQMLAQGMSPGNPLPYPKEGFTEPSQDSDARKVARQHDLLDEQIAFVMGHELSHHHLGHTGCATGQARGHGVSPSDLARILANRVPLFNQPNEIAADVSGTQNLLAAGARRQGLRWNEEGALLTLEFFSTMQQLTPGVLLFGFMQTHPPPQLRLPIVQQTANAWRLTGGQMPTLPGFGGLFP
jgi:hypothetical protein